MKSLKEIIEDAQKNKSAVGHFNVSEFACLKAIVQAAQNLRLPVVIGVSEGERRFLGVKTIAAVVQSLRKEFDMPIFLNADHTHSLEDVKEAVEAKFDSIIFDGSKLPFSENIAKTKEAVKYVRSKNKNILVEGELGYIGSSSELLSAIPEGAAIAEKDLTKPEEAAQFVKETNVDLFAPAVGNLHGMLANASEPALNIACIQELQKAVNVPLVLHGGSGIAEEQVKQAVAAGISIVHFSTELRKAWRDALEQSLKTMPNEVAPYKLLALSVSEIQKIAETKLKLLTGV